MEEKLFNVGDLVYIGYDVTDDNVESIEKEIDGIKYWCYPQQNQNEKEIVVVFHEVLGIKKIEINIEGEYEDYYDMYNENGITYRYSLGPGDFVRVLKDYDYELNKHLLDKSTFPAFSGIDKKQQLFKSYDEAYENKKNQS